MTPEDLRDIALRDRLAVNLTRAELDRRALLAYIDLLHEDLRITRAERDAEKKTVLFYRKVLALAIIELGKKDTK